MADAAAAPRLDASAPPPPWHERLHARLQDLERAAAALLAVCEEPDAAAALEARDLGYSSAAALVQLQAAPLLQRLELASEQVLRARGTLAPRTDAASGAGCARHGALGFAHLPHAVALHVLSFVPADARARAALVCRAWRVTVADPRLWTVLNLSRASGVARPVSVATLRGAAALARGGLTKLRLDGCSLVTHVARMEAVTANAGSLRELSCVSVAAISSAHVEELAGAAPQLVVFKVDVIQASVVDATRMLRNEAPFGALQLRKLHSIGPDIAEGEARLDEPEVIAFCSAVSAHASLRRLQLRDIPLDAPAVIDALSNAALACKLRVLECSGCDLSPASVPALARLIRGGTLTSLLIDNGGDPLLDEATGAQLADALAASRTLTRLKLSDVDFWDNAPAAALIMRALTGHPSLQELNLSWNTPPDEFSAGAALGALVAANVPALRDLQIYYSTLGDAGLGGLCYALPRNTHLRELCLYRTGMSAEFARHTFLPSVRANTSLRTLVASMSWDPAGNNEAPPELLEAEALVAARNHDGA